MQSGEVANSTSITSLDFVDLSDYCRLCLQIPEDSQLLDLQLIYDEEEQLSYYDCFIICTQIDLHAGGINAPHQLCKSCGLELQVAYDFHKKVQESKKFLLQFQKSHITDGEALDTTMTKDGTQQETDILIEDLEQKTSDDTEVAEPIQLENESIDNEIATAEEENIEQLEAPIEYEELEEHIEMEEYQSVDELMDDGQMEYVCIEEYKPVPAEVISTAKSIVDTTKCFVELTTKIDNNNSITKPFECIKATETAILPKGCGSKMKNTDPLSTSPIRADTSHLPIQIIRPQRTSRVCCDYCSKSFPSRSKMLWHRRMHEPDRPRFNCPFDGCDRTYLSRQSCDLHYKQTHSSPVDYQPLECRLCHKTFAIPQTLEIHMRYHTREFPYECTHCERRFAQKGHLTAHLQVMHNNLRYICPVEGCGKVFKNTISLRNHSFSHTGMPFRCAYCDRGYPQKSKLKVHLKLKHDVVMSIEELETMRKLKSFRTRHTFVKLQAMQSATANFEEAEGSLDSGDINEYFVDVVGEK
uniref:Krueppel homologous protein 1 n=1 Tax=Zeugodacus cucurbitae TaxID=28588 RepID=A0A0A1WJV4_ZEUCU